MDLSIDCLACMLNKTMTRLVSLQDEHTRDCANEVLAFLSQVPPGVSGPRAAQQMNAIVARYYPEHIDYRAVKRHFNALLLSWKPDLERAVQAAPDPLVAALGYALIGNYIDFGAMAHVDEQMFTRLVEQAAERPLDEAELARFRAELGPGKTVAFLHDNCGEIVLDTLLIDQLRRLGCRVVSVVRGQEVINDVTREDAEQIGLTDFIDNGNGVAGTDPALLSPACRELLTQSDLIVSKGQGNFETLYGCGWNVYYLFLCKCDYFTRRFGMERLKGVFANELRLAL